MWAIIVLLSVGLFNMFQDPKKINTQQNTISFSNFLTEVDNGRVVEVQIQGNNISGVLSDGKTFKKGDFVLYEPGSKHFSHTINGCLVLVFMRGINQPL